MTRLPTPDLRARLRSLADDARGKQQDLAATHLSGLAAAGVPDLDLAIGVAAAGEAFSNPTDQPIRSATWHIMAQLHDPPPLHREPMAPGGDVVLAACAQAGVLSDVLARLGLSLSQDNGCVVVRSGERILAALPLAEWREAVVNGAPWAANAGPRLPVVSTEPTSTHKAPKIDWPTVLAAMERLCEVAIHDGSVFHYESAAWVDVVEASQYLRGGGRDLGEARRYAQRLANAAKGSAHQPMAEELCRSLGMKIVILLPDSVGGGK